MSELIGNIYVGKSEKFGCGSVDPDIAHTLLTGGESAIILGYIDHGTGQHQSNTIYSTMGISPAITTIEGGGTQQIKVLVDE